GQPDEPFASMDQGSVQQLSDEYLSPVNPSDIEALYETSLGEDTSGEQASGEETSGEYASAEHTSSEHASGEETSGEHASGEETSGEQASGKESSGEHASGEETSGEHASGEQTSGEDTSGEDTSGEQASGKKSDGNQALDEHPSGEQPSSTPLPNTSSGAILNCHTCAYMNDKGKCLRGEGMCTTENSQQCMLKKIFKGGKLQFMVQGCENKCPSMNFISQGTRMQIICC
ncbi:Acrosomal protein SP-10, partial [Heterocephalus glaber]